MMESYLCLPRRRLYVSSAAKGKGNLRSFRRRNRNPRRSSSTYGEDAGMVKWFNRVPSRLRAMQRHRLPETRRHVVQQVHRGLLLRRLCTGNQLARWTGRHDAALWCAAAVRAGTGERVMCDCISYNRPEPMQKTRSVFLNPMEYFSYDSIARKVPVDACIADDIRRLCPWG